MSKFFTLTNFPCQVLFAHVDEKKWKVFPWPVSLLKSWHASFSTRKLVKQKLGILLCPHEEVKLVKENLPRWKPAHVDCANMWYMHWDCHGCWQLVLMTGHHDKASFMWHWNNNWNGTWVIRKYLEMLNDAQLKTYMWWNMLFIDQRPLMLTQPFTSTQMSKETAESRQ